MEILFFSNGNTAVFDKQTKEQVTDLQEGWLNLFCEFLESKGFSPAEIEDCQFTLPDGMKIRVRKTPLGDYNWRPKHWDAS